MVLDTIGREFIYSEEGVRLEAYLDVVGVPTIGVGCTYYPTGAKVKISDKITKQECDTLFTKVAKEFEDAVNRNVNVPLTQNQFNALVSFSFNVGTGAFLKSTLLKKINARAPLIDIQIEFNKWVKGGGRTLKVLVGRRMREFKLYSK
jgi:lysozyme